MATVRAIGTDALMELGVIAPGAAMPATMANLVLNRAQGMIDAWAAIRITLSLQLRTVFTMPDGDSSIQIGSGQAVDIVRRSDKASASLLQRRLRIGYARAARILDQMEDRGIVGPADGSRFREVLVTSDGWGGDYAPEEDDDE